MISIAIVEDEEESMNVLKESIERFQKETGEEFAISCFFDGLSLLMNYAPRFDLIFMDIRMPNIDGVETARRLRKIDKEVGLIFVTDMYNLAIKGYEVGAMDFLVKPIVYYDFCYRMKRFLALSAQRRRSEILLTTEGAIKRVDKNNIAYLEVVGHRVCYHMVNGEKLDVRSSLVTEKKKLPAEYFVLCNSGYLVNLNYVREIRGDYVYVAGDCLPISRPKKKEFIARLSAHIASK